MFSELLPSKIIHRELHQKNAEIKFGQKLCAYILAKNLELNIIGENGSRNLKYDPKTEGDVGESSGKYKKLMFFLEEGKFRVDLHPGRGDSSCAGVLTDQSVWLLREDHQLRPLPGNEGVLTATDLAEVSKIEKNARVGFNDVLQKLYTEIHLRAKEENQIKLRKKEVPTICILLLGLYSTFL